MLKNAESIIKKQNEQIRYQEKIIAELTLEIYKLKSQEDILFSDYIIHWLDVIKDEVQITTLQSYQSVVRNHILPYFKQKAIMLGDIKPKEIYAYYRKLSLKLSNNTIRKHHANISKCLSLAVEEGLIEHNPAKSIKLPKIKPFYGLFLTKEQISQIDEKSRDTIFNLPILLAGTLGLRRSEVLGLRWDNIDLDKGTVSICHVAVKIIIDGHYKVHMKDCTKTVSSNRVINLPQFLIDKLKIVKKMQVSKYIKNRNHYCKTYLKYVCVDSFGRIIKPDDLSSYFKKISTKLFKDKNIRFHDLRHTCASNLYSMGFTLKDIQKWLGHNSIKTTADIYTHLPNEQFGIMAKAIDELIINA